MNTREIPVVFDCDSEPLVGIAAMPETPADIGVLIVVGGPQYRVGSHRQFVQLARFLAGEGFASFRFDYRGMGDSAGKARTFEDVEADIHAAARAFRDIQPGMSSLVVFGLCDGGSAALMAAANIGNLAGLIIANPWVRRGESLNEAVVRHYYWQRLFSMEFWRKVATGRFQLAPAAAEFLGRISRLLAGTGHTNDSGTDDFVDRMRRGWQLPVKKLLLMSGQDLTAREFDDLRSKDKRWARLHSAAGLVESPLPHADHTFSQARWRDEVHMRCRDFLIDLTAPRGPRLR
jgi:exosortase A-associated hydrolase 1